MSGLEHVTQVLMGKKPEPPPPVKRKRGRPRKVVKKVVKPRPATEVVEPPPEADESQKSVEVFQDNRMAVARAQAQVSLQVTQEIRDHDVDSFLYQVAIAVARAVAEVRAAPLAQLQCIGPSELGKLLGRSTMMIRVDASRRPDTLPPRFVVPKMSKMLWRVVDVKEWMQALADVEQDKRAAQIKFARTHGIPAPTTTAKFSVGDPALGTQATARMFAKRAAEEAK